MTHSQNPCTSNPHQSCFACSPEHPGGLGLRFEHTDLNHLESVVSIDPVYQGYDGCVHGGIIATVLDAAMTHLLLYRNIPAMTAKLDIRYKNPMRPDTPAKVTAEIERERPPLYELKAKLVQNQNTVAFANARFMLPTTISYPEITHNG